MSATSILFPCHVSSRSGQRFLIFFNILDNDRAVCKMLFTCHIFKVSDNVGQRLLNYSDLWFDWLRLTDHVARLFCPYLILLHLFSHISSIHHIYGVFLLVFFLNAIACCKSFLWLMPMIIIYSNRMCLKCFDILIILWSSYQTFYHFCVMYTLILMNALGPFFEL